MNIDPIIFLKDIGLVIKKTQNYKIESLFKKRSKEISSTGKEKEKKKEKNKL